MKFKDRAAGVLLHFTSLPGPHGIGDFGPDAYHFVDWLVGAGQHLWQVLPTTPIGPADSPYQSVSAFAGSPLMVSLEPLVVRGWLPPPALPEGGFDPHRVDYGQVGPWRLGQLRAAAAGFQAQATIDDRNAFTGWTAAQSHWLDDYTLFMALETAHGGKPWWLWDEPLMHRDPEALRSARRRHAEEIAFWEFVQWNFDTQCTALRAYANERDVWIMGDLPIFVAHHSADVWARPDLYELDDAYQPVVVAGVPPDAFAAEGQRWGNPLYRWDRMAADNFSWWTERIKRALAQSNIFRIDHFRGFAAYWEVPADSPTAKTGRWVPGPGKALFDAIERALGPLRIIAEDLGVITPDVVVLRDACGFPGMRVLQFAFGDDATNDYLPHNYVANSVVYTGTHDNETTRGWWDHAPEHERAFAGSYLATRAEEVHWSMIRAACNSVAHFAIFPFQDVLGLGAEHRMNLPGSAEGNWAWRFDWPMVDPEPARVLGLITAASGRGPFKLLGG